MKKGLKKAAKGMKDKKYPLADIVANGFVS